MKYFLALIIIFFALSAQAQMIASEKMSDPVLQSRAEILYKDIRCVVCHSQSIDGSDSEMAAALRADVRRQLLAGAGDAAILEALRAHYGDAVLMKPPFRVGTWGLWLMPAFLFVFGCLMAARTLRRIP